MRFPLCFFLILAATLSIRAEEPLQTGVFTTQFDERSPHSSLKEMLKMARWPPEKVRDYDIEEHAFQLVVPQAYDGSEAYGLLVFIHPNNAIDLERFYGRAIREVLAKHKLIWVSYDKAGNEVMPNVRMGLALDAVHNAAKRYRVDEKRVYVSGLSGGGRMTCMAGIYYPQVFTGAIPIVGTLYFRDVKLPEDPELRGLIRPVPPDRNAVWPRALFKPTNKQLAKMTKEQRWVLLAGEKDYNMPQMRAHFEQGFQRDGFELAQYLEVEGMGHQYPDAKWYDRAIEMLEQGAEDPSDRAPANERTQRLAQRRLEVALRTLDRDRDRGIRALERLIEDLPNTGAAQQALEKLKELDLQ